MKNLVDYEFWVQKRTDFTKLCVCSVYYHDTRRITLSGVWWARDPEEPGAGANQGTAETADRTRTGTGPTPTLTARQGTQA
jgi:hypothetical protein